MTRMLLAAGVAALAIASPAAADPGKKEGGKGGARVERVKSFGEQRMKVRDRAFEQANKAREHSFERQKKFAEARFERRKKADEQRFEARKNLFERQAKVEKRLLERREKLVERQFKAREDVFKQRSKQLETMAERRRDAIRVRDFDDDDRWIVAGRGQGLIDGCPPGLAKQNALCMPPGQFKKRMEGQLLPAAYRERLLPLGLRDIYRDDDDYYWRYGDNGYLYKVDRDTNLVASLLPLLGAGYGVGQLFPTSYMNSYVPSYYRPFYADSDDDYYRYANGYVYEIDRDTGLIEDMIPLMANGYGVGQMLPASYSVYNVPYQYRDTYYDNDDYLYRYAPGAIYQVDPTTRLITSIVSLLSPNSFGIGQRLPAGYGVYNVPMAYRDDYYDTPDAWYRYNNGYIYQVDPTTQLITAIVRAIT